MGWEARGGDLRPWPGSGWGGVHGSSICGRWGSGNYFALADIELRGTPCRLWERRAAGMSAGTEAPKRPVQRLCRCTEGKRLAEEARETNSDGPRPPSASRQPAGGVGSLATPGTTQAVPAVQTVAPAQTTTNGVGLDRFGRGSCFSVWPFVKKGAKVAPGAGGVRGGAGTGPRPFAYRHTRELTGRTSSRTHGIPPSHTPPLHVRPLHVLHVRPKN